MNKPDHRLPALETERLVLRTLELPDAPDIFRVFSDPRVMRYWSSPAQPEVSAAEALIRHIHDVAKARTLFQWGISRRDDGRVIGTCTLAHLDFEHGRAELGYALSSAEWGHGYAREAVTRVLEHAFVELGLHRMEADVDPRNLPSIRLLDRLGFTREGFLPERYFVAGERQDTLLMGLLARDFRRPLAESPALVRPFSERDLPAVLDMLVMQLEEHDLPAERDTLEAAIRAVLLRPDLGAILVADEGAGPIGFAYLGFTFTLEHGGHVSWLEELYVRPPLRGRGLGKAMLDAAMAFVRARGARTMELEVVAGHERAANLYVRAGFKRLNRVRWQTGL